MGTNSTVHDQLPVTPTQWSSITGPQLHSTSALPSTAATYKSFPSKFGGLCYILPHVLLCLQFLFLVILMVTVIVNILFIIDTRNRLQQQQQRQLTNGEGKCFYWSLEYNLKLSSILYLRRTLRRL